MDVNRRTLLIGISAAALCSAFPGSRSLAQFGETRFTYQSLYAPVDDLYPVPGVDLSRINPAFLRRLVPYETPEAPGTIVIDPRAHYLYLVQGDGTALRYGVGVGRSGFSWSGSATVKDKQEWPDWYPPKEMFDRQPELMENMGELPGGPGMPCGTRALRILRAGSPRRRSRRSRGPTSGR